MLKEAGLIRGEIDGPRVGYCVEPLTTRRLKALVGSLQEPRMSETALASAPPASVARRLPFLDRYLTLRIFLAMGAGIEAARLEAFRRVRDELRRRLAVVLSSST